MYIPRAFHWWLPVAVVSLGFFLYEHFGRAWEVILFVQVPFGAIAIEWGAYIWQAGVVYQKYLAKVDGNVPVYKPIVPNLNTLTTNVLYNKNVPTPRFANERLFAFTITRQHDHKFKVDLTESYWIKAGRWHGSREEFVSMLDKWKARGIIARASARKNSSYEVLQWDAVRLIADGNPLPD